MATGHPHFHLCRRPSAAWLTLLSAWLLVFAPLVCMAQATTDANQANQAELEMVKGVGPQLSSLILAERARTPFRDWTDFIDRLPGIGPVKARRLSDAGLTVAGQTLAPAAGAAAASAR